MRLQRIEPERVLAWRSENGNWVWSFILTQTSGSTKLISRNRFRLPRLIDRIGMIPMEPASLIMERKMLLRIKQRAEHLAVRGGDAADQPRPLGEPLPDDPAAGPDQVELPSPSARACAEQDAQAVGRR